MRLCARTARWLTCLGLLCSVAAPSALAEDTPPANTLARSAGDASLRTLVVEARNPGPGDATSVQITLHDTPGHAADSWAIDQPSPTGKCTALQPTGAAHGVTCTWAPGEFLAGQTKRIAFRTDTRYPVMGGASMVVNGGPAIDLPGPPDVKPVARFSLTRGKVNQIVHFNASKSTDADGHIAKYAWNFDDGKKGTGRKVTHTFKGGSFDVRLVVTDDSGVKDSFRKEVFVRPPPPTASFSDPDHVTLRATASLGEALSGGEGLLGLAALGAKKTKAFGAPFFVLAASDAGLAAALRRAATIKRDAKYRTVPVPHARYIGRFDPGAGVSRRLARSIKELAGLDSKINAYVNVLAVNINRAETAKTESQSLYQERQFHAAARAASKAAKLLKGRRALRLAVASALRGHHAKMGASAAKRLAARVGSKGLPKSATKLLGDLAITASSRRAMTRAMKNVDGAVDAASALSAGKVTRGERRAAKTLKAFAREAGK